jgi:hypothetical protein
MTIIENTEVGLWFVMQNGIDIAVFQTLQEAQNYVTEHAN